MINNEDNNDIFSSDENLEINSDDDVSDISSISNYMKRMKLLGKSLFLVITKIIMTKFL